MSSKKTLASEFAAACGALNMDLSKKSFSLIGNTSEFEHDKALSLITDPDIYDVYHVAKNVKNNPDFYGKKIVQANWLGDDKSNAIASKDIELITIPKGAFYLSVKLNSNMLWNMAPQKALNDFWFSNIRDSSRNKDYYLEIASKELQDYFEECDGPRFTGYPRVEKYYESRSDKKAFSTHCSSITQKGKPTDAYQALCRKVSKTAAKTLTENIHILGLEPSHLILPMWAIFRLNNFSYTLVGMDHNSALCMQVPAAAKWENDYEICSIEAKDGLAKQPQVDISFTIRNKRTKEEYTFEVFIEIRWSHGKFCGNPEGKIQKRFNYAHLPWLVDLRR